MKTELDLVRDLGFDCINLCDESAHGANPRGLLLSERTLHSLASDLEEIGAVENDTRYTTAALLADALADVLDGLGSQDEPDALSGLTTLLHATLWAAVRYDLPLQDAFIEWHLSQLDDNEWSAGKWEKLIEAYRASPTPKHPSAIKQLEAKWLEQHPRLFDALKPQQKSMIETVAAGMAAGGKMETYVEGKLLEIVKWIAERPVV